MSNLPRAIFYGTETTGIKTSEDRIVELAAYDPERDLTFQRLINPGCPIPSEASAIHHITNEMVANSPSFAAIAQEFVQFCEGDVILIAHNSDAFDLPIMRSEFARHKCEMPSWRFVDSLKWSRRYRCDLPRHTLQFLREIYGFESNQAHRALDDVVILHKVFKMMTDDLHIEQVYALINKPKDLQHMPFGKFQGKPLQQVPADYVTWLANSGALDKPEDQELRTTLKKLGLLVAS